MEQNDLNEFGQAANPYASPESWDTGGSNAKIWLPEELLDLALWIRFIRVAEKNAFFAVLFILIPVSMFYLLVWWFYSGTGEFSKSEIYLACAILITAAILYTIFMVREIYYLAKVVIGIWMLNRKVGVFIIPIFASPIYRAQKIIKAAGYDPKGFFGPDTEQFKKQISGVKNG